MQRYTIKIEGTEGDEYLHVKNLVQVAATVDAACAGYDCFPGRPINITVYDKWKKKEFRPDLNYYFKRV